MYRKAIAMLSQMRCFFIASKVKKVKKEIYKESKLSYILSRRYTRTREKTCFLNFEKKGFACYGEAFQKITSSFGSPALTLQHNQNYQS